MTDITNFGTLKAELIALSKRTDLATRVASFVTRAENMVNRNVRSLENTAQYALTDANRLGPTSQWYFLPARVLEVLDVSTSDYRHLTRRTLWELDRFKPLGTTHSYTPVTPFNPEAAAPSNEPMIRIADNPAAASVFGVLYTYGLGSMAADADTNGLLKKHPELYLYGALHWVAFDAKDFDEANTMLDYFTSTVARVNSIAERARRSGASPNLITLNHGSSM